MGLARGDEDEILAETLAQLVREGWSHRPAGIARPGANSSGRDPFLDPELHLVVALDDLDQAEARHSRPFHNFLAHLRNCRPKGNLSYILAAAGCGTLPRAERAAGQSV